MSGPFSPQTNLRGHQTGTMSSVAQTVVSTPVLGASATRGGVFFFNDTNVGNCLVSFGATASLSQFTNKIAPSGSWFIPNAPLYCGPITVAWDAAGAGNLRITETGG